MGVYADRILPRLTDVALGSRELSRLRARVAAGLAGQVLEIGFGTGRNAPHYPATVTGVWAVDPVPAGRKLAAGRVAARGIRVDHIGADAQELPLADASADCVLSTWTLCSIPDPGRALAEIRRVLRPGGAFHFLEHGRSPDPRVARWQDRLTPLQRRVAGGCHLNRPIADLVRTAGLEMTRLDTYYLPGPRTFGYMFEGVATKAGNG
jgi:ubiquinone/menaquinone biosynthesis C-methylase UbiE